MFIKIQGRETQTSLKGKDAQDFVSFVQTNMGPFRIKLYQGACRLYKSFLLFSYGRIWILSCSYLKHIASPWSNYWFTNSSFKILNSLHGHGVTWELQKWRNHWQVWFSSLWTKVKSIFSKRCWEHKWLNYWWLSAPILLTIKYSTHRLLWHKFLIPQRSSHCFQIYMSICVVDCHFAHTHSLSLYMCVHIHTYICVYTYMCIHIHVYILKSAYRQGDKVARTKNTRACKTHTCLWQAHCIIQINI